MYRYDLAFLASENLNFEWGSNAEAFNQLNIVTSKVTHASRKSALNMMTQDDVSADQQTEDSDANLILCPFKLSDTDNFYELILEEKAADGDFFDGDAYKDFKARGHFDTDGFVTKKRGDHSYTIIHVIVLNYDPSIR